MALHSAFPFDRFEHDRAAASRELKMLLRQDPEAFLTAVVEGVRDGEDNPGLGYGLWLLHQRGFLMDLLLDPDGLEPALAQRVANVASRGVPNFDLLVASVLKKGVPELSRRAMALLASIPITKRVLPVLTAALPSVNADVRARIALLFGRVCQNSLLTSRLAGDAVPRVRANTMQALWHSSHPWTAKVFEEGLRDPAQRVAANAALGLHALGDPRGIRALREMTERPSAPHRTSAVWALGETRDRQCIPLLERLTLDESRSVARTARGAIEKIQRAVSTAAAAGRLGVAILSSVDRPGGWRRLVANVRDPKGVPLRHLAPAAFTILEDGEPALDRTFKEPANRDRLILAYVLDYGALSWANSEDDVTHAAIKSLRTKQPTDRVVVIKFSASVEGSPSFSSDLMQLNGVLRQPYKGPVDPPHFYDAISRAIDFVNTQRGIPAVVALSSGVTAGDETHRADVIDKARRIGVPVYTIGFGDAADHDILRSVSTATHGGSRSVALPSGLGDAFSTVFREISTIYSFLYRPPVESAERVQLRVQGAEGIGEAELVRGAELTPTVA